MNDVTEYTSVETEWSRKATMMEFAAFSMPTKLPLPSQVNILKDGLLENRSYSRPHLAGNQSENMIGSPTFLLGEIQTWTEGREQRLARIRAVRGKYASVLTSSEAFAQRKRDEIKLER